MAADPAFSFYLPSRISLFPQHSICRNSQTWQCSALAHTWITLLGMTMPGTSQGWAHVFFLQACSQFISLLLEWAARADPYRASSRDQPPHQYEQCAPSDPTGERGGAQLCIRPTPLLASLPSALFSFFPLKSKKGKQELINYQFLIDFAEKST